jgi:nitroreductase
MVDNTVKHASPDHEILEPLAKRYSPYVFDPKPVETPKLLSCLEAARWAPSSFNEQPWSFIVATRDDAGEFQRMIDCLTEANQEWAKDAGVVMLTVVCKTFARNGKPNRVAEHDVGLAMGNLCVQATTLGLHVHQMAGVNLAKARQTYNIPDTHEPFTAAAIGYAGDPKQAANQDLAQRDLSPRPRKPLAEIVFTGNWRQAAPFLTAE